MKFLTILFLSSLLLLTQAIRLSSKTSSNLRATAKSCSSDVIEGEEGGNAETTENDETSDAAAQNEEPHPAAENSVLEPEPLVIPAVDKKGAGEVKVDNSSIADSYGQDFVDDVPSVEPTEEAPENLHPTEIVAPQNSEEEPSLQSEPTSEQNAGNGVSGETTEDTQENPTERGTQQESSEEDEGQSVDYVSESMGQATSFLQKPRNY